MSKRAVFLDKDGTLIDDIADNTDPLRITLCHGAGAGLRLLERLDYRFIVVSNQDGVARGMFCETALEPVRDRLGDLLFREQLDLDGFYYCPLARWPATRSIACAENPCPACCCRRRATTISTCTSPG